MAVRHRLPILALLAMALSGCAVVTVAGAAVAVGVAVVDTAVDVTVGAAKVTGKAVGSAIEAANKNEPGADGTAAKSPPPEPTQPQR